MNSAQETSFKSYLTRSWRITALTVACLFASQQLLFAAPQTALTAATARTAARTEAAARGAAAGFGAAELPRSIATVDETYVAPGAAARTVYLIQDAHTNASGQINVSKILDHLLERENIQYVFLEAGEGDVSLSFLRKRVPLKRRQEVGLSFLRKGLLQGSEYTNLTSDKNFMLWGVEDIALYDAALLAYAHIAKNRPRDGAYLSKIRKTFQVISEKIYNAELQSFQELSRKYAKEDVSLTNYFSALRAIARREGIAIEPYQNLKVLEEIQAQEAQLDFVKIAAEQVKALRSLSSLDRKTVMDMTKAAPMLKTHISGDADPTRGLYALLGEKLKSREGFEELLRYIAYLKRFEGIQIKAMLNELENFHDAIQKALVLNEREERLLDVERNIGIMERLLELEITPDEFKIFETEQDSFDLAYVTGILNRFIMDLEGHYDRALVLDNDLDVTLKQAAQFYKLTYARDKAFLQEMSQKMSGEENSHAVLIAGGYHTPNLTSLLKQNGISYVVISPQIFHPTDHKRYERLLLSQEFSGKSARTSVMTANVQPITNAARKSKPWRAYAEQLMNSLQVPDAMLELLAPKGSRRTHEPTPLHVAGSRYPDLDEAYQILIRVAGEGIRKYAQNALAMARRIVAQEDPRIENITVIGTGSLLLPLLLAMAGKKVDFITKDFTNNMREGSFEGVKSGLEEALQWSGYSGSLQIVTIRALWGEVDLDAYNLRDSSDLVTMVDLVDDNPQGNPREWLEQARDVLREDGYLLIDESLALKENSIMRHLADIFPDYKLISTDFLTGDWNLNTSRRHYLTSEQATNRLYRIRQKEGRSLEEASPQAIAAKLGANIQQRLLGVQKLRQVGEENQSALQLIMSELRPGVAERIYTAIADNRLWPQLEADMSNEDFSYGLLPFQFILIGRDLEHVLGEINPREFAEFQLSPATLHILERHVANLEQIIQHLPIFLEQFNNPAGPEPSSLSQVYRPEIDPELLVQLKAHAFAMRDAMREVRPNLLAVVGSRDVPREAPFYDVNGNITWEGLKAEGYAIEVTSVHDADAPETFRVRLFNTEDSKSVQRHAQDIEFWVYPTLQLVFINSFFPEFPRPASDDERVGRGRALLRHILYRLGFAGYEVIVDALDPLQESLRTMTDFQTIAVHRRTAGVDPGEMATQLEDIQRRAELSENALTDHQKQRLIQTVLRTVNTHLVVPTTQEIWINPTPQQTTGALPLANFMRAAQVLRGDIIDTPLLEARRLSAITGKRVFIKDESLQLGGSFKTRGVTFQVYENIKAILESARGGDSNATRLLDEGIEIVTQTDGNHGAAMISAIWITIENLKVEYPEFNEQIKRIAPVVFTIPIERLPTVKYNNLEEALRKYRRIAGNDLGRIEYLASYEAAALERANYVARREGRAIYMDHGGPQIMTGHGTAGLEIVYTLTKMGIPEDQRVVVIPPVGAGGPVGLISAKAKRPNTSLVIAQANPDLNAFVRTLRQSTPDEIHMAWNVPSTYPTAFLGEGETREKIIFPDGIAVDKPENFGTVEIMFETGDAAVSVDSRQAFFNSGVLLFDDLRQAYDAHEDLDPEDVRVGGTTAITAEALLAYGDQIPAIRDADVVVLFATEGTVEGNITTHLESRLQYADAIQASYESVGSRANEFFTANYVSQRNGDGPYEFVLDGVLSERDLTITILKDRRDIGHLKARLTRSAGKITSVDEVRFNLNTEWRHLGVMTEAWRQMGMRLPLNTVVRVSVKDLVTLMGMYRQLDRFMADLDEKTHANWRALQLLGHLTSATPSRPDQYSREISSLVEWLLMPVTPDTLQHKFVPDYLADLSYGKLLRVAGVDPMTLLAGVSVLQSVKPSQNGIADIYIEGTKTSDASSELPTLSRLHDFYAFRAANDITIIEDMLHKYGLNSSQAREFVQHLREGFKDPYIDGKFSKPGVEPAIAGFVVGEADFEQSQQNPAILRLYHFHDGTVDPVMIGNDTAVEVGTIGGYRYDMYTWPGISPQANRIVLIGDDGKLSLIDITNPASVKYIRLGGNSANQYQLDGEIFYPYFEVHEINSLVGQQPVVSVRDGRGNVLHFDFLTGHPALVHGARASMGNRFRQRIQTRLTLRDLQVLKRLLAQGVDLNDPVKVARILSDADYTLADPESDHRVRQMIADDLAWFLMQDTPVDIVTANTYTELPGMPVKERILDEILTRVPAQQARNLRGITRSGYMWVSYDADGNETLSPSNVSFTSEEALEVSRVFARSFLEEVQRKFPTVDLNRFELTVLNLTDRTSVQTFIEGLFESVAIKRGTEAPFRLDEGMLFIAFQDDALDSTRILVRAQELLSHWPAERPPLRFFNARYYAAVSLHSKAEEFTRILDEAQETGIYVGLGDGSDDRQALNVLHHSNKPSLSLFLNPDVRLADDEVLIHPRGINRTFVNGAQGLLHELRRAQSTKDTYANLGFVQNRWTPGQVAQAYDLTLADFQQILQNESQWDTFNLTGARSAQKPDDLDDREWSLLTLIHDDEDWVQNGFRTKEVDAKYGFKFQPIVNVRNASSGSTLAVISRSAKKLVAAGYLINVNRTNYRFTSKSGKVFGIEIADDDVVLIPTMFKEMAVILLYLKEQRTSVSELMISNRTKVNAKQVRAHMPRLLKAGWVTGDNADGYVLTTAQKRKIGKKDATELTLHLQKTMGSRAFATREELANYLNKGYVLVIAEEDSTDTNLLRAALTKLEGFDIPSERVLRVPQIRAAVSLVERLNRRIVDRPRQVRLILNLTGRNLMVEPTSLTLRYPMAAGGTRILDDEPIVIGNARTTVDASTLLESLDQFIDGITDESPQVIRWPDDLDERERLVLEILGSSVDYIRSGVKVKDFHAKHRKRFPSKQHGKGRDWINVEALQPYFVSLITKGYLERNTRATYTLTDKAASLLRLDSVEIGKEILPIKADIKAELSYLQNSARILVYIARSGSVTLRDIQTNVFSGEYELKRRSVPVWIEYLKEHKFIKGKQRFQLESPHSQAKQIRQIERDAETYMRQVLDVASGARVFATHAELANYLNEGYVLILAETGSKQANALRGAVAKLEDVRIPQAQIVIVSQLSEAISPIKALNNSFLDKPRQARLILNLTGRTLTVDPMSLTLRYPVGGTRILDDEPIVIGDAQNTVDVSTLSEALDRFVVATEETPVVVIDWPDELSEHERLILDIFRDHVDYIQAGVTTRDFYHQHRRQFPVSKHSRHVDSIRLPVLVSNFSKLVKSGYLSKSTRNIYTLTARAAALLGVNLADIGSGAGLSYQEARANIAYRESAPKILKYIARHGQVTIDDLRQHLFRTDVSKKLVEVWVARLRTEGYIEGSEALTLKSPHDQAVSEIEEDPAAYMSTHFSGARSRGYQKELDLSKLGPQRQRNWEAILAAIADIRTVDGKVTVRAIVDETTLSESQIRRFGTENLKRAGVSFDDANQNIQEVEAAIQRLDSQGEPPTIPNIVSVSTLTLYQVQGISSETLFAMGVDINSRKFNLRRVEEAVAELQDRQVDPTLQTVMQETGLTRKRIDSLGRETLESAGVVLPPPKMRKRATTKESTPKKTDDTKAVTKKKTVKKKAADAQAAAKKKADDERAVKQAAKEKKDDERAAKKAVADAAAAERKAAREAAAREKEAQSEHAREQERLLRNLNRRIDRQLAELESAPFDRVRAAQNRILKMGAEAGRRPEVQMRVDAIHLELSQKYHEITSRAQRIRTTDPDTFRRQAEPLLAEAKRLGFEDKVMGELKRIWERNLSTHGARIMVRSASFQEKVKALLIGMMIAFTPHALADQVLPIWVQDRTTAQYKLELEGNAVRAVSSTLGARTIVIEDTRQAIQTWRRTRADQPAMNVTQHISAQTLAQDFQAAHKIVDQFFPRKLIQQDVAMDLVIDLNIFSDVPDLETFKGDMRKVALDAWRLKQRAPSVRFVLQNFGDLPDEYVTTLDGFLRGDQQSQLLFDGRTTELQATVFEITSETERESAGDDLRLHVEKVTGNSVPYLYGHFMVAKITVIRLEDLLAAGTLDENVAAARVPESVRRYIGKHANTKPPTSLEYIQLIKSGSRTLIARFIQRIARPIKAWSIESYRMALKWLESAA